MSSIPRFQIDKLIFSKMIGPLIDLVIDQSESEEWETSDLEDLIFFFFFPYGNVSYGARLGSCSGSRDSKLFHLE